MCIRDRPEPGHTVQLTIDSRFQKAVDKALAENIDMINRCLLYTSLHHHAQQVALVTDHGIVDGHAIQRAAVQREAIEGCLLYTSRCV